MTDETTPPPPRYSSVVRYEPGIDRSHPLCPEVATMSQNPHGKWVTYDAYVDMEAKAIGLLWAIPGPTNVGDVQQLYNTARNLLEGTIPANRLSEFWKRVYPEGMPLDRALAELHDFEFVMEQVPTVYCHVTGGRISKANTYASAVIGEHDTVRQEEIDEAIKEYQLEGRDVELLEAMHQLGANEGETLIQLAYRVSKFIELLEDKLHEKQAHPHFEYQTTTCGRKQFYGEAALEEAGWVYNVYGGDTHTSWDRGDYQEWHYWRRRKEDVKLDPNPIQLYDKLLVKVHLLASDCLQNTTEWKVVMDQIKDYVQHKFPILKT